MNHMIHLAAISHIRLDTDGRAYYRRKRAGGCCPVCQDLLRQVGDFLPSAQGVIG